MSAEVIGIDNIYVPEILKAEKDFLLAFKPAMMHSAPRKNQSGGTILDYCCAAFPEVKTIRGRKPGEGGLLHRLDYETHGLILLARTKEGMDSLLAQQTEGNITKEYTALAMKSETRLPGFTAKEFYSPADKLTIKSAFRAYGKGRKAVRPVSQGGKEYATEILEVNELPGSVYSFRVKILSGFRHQIRCHLAWIGFPIVNDKLYGGRITNDGIFGLCACSIAFLDPSTGERREYSTYYADSGK